MGDISGLNRQQKILNLSPGYIMLCFAAGGVGIYFIVSIICFFFTSEQKYIYTNSYWLVVLGIIFGIGGILSITSIFFKRHCTLTPGKCSVTCGGGTISDVSLKQAPLFGGNCPISTKWNGGYCNTQACTASGLTVVAVPNYISPIPSSFNQNVLTSAIGIYVTPFTSKKNFKFSDSCTFKPVHNSYNSYTVMTTTRYIDTQTKSGMLLSTNIDATSPGATPDANGNTKQVYGSANMNVTSIQYTDGTFTQTANIPVNIDIIFNDTVTAVLINNKNVLTPLSTGASATRTVPNGLKYDVIKLVNVQLDSPSNINTLDIVMTAATTGVLMYCVYDTIETGNIYMQSTLESTTVNAAASALG